MTKFLLNRDSAEQTITYEKQIISTVESTMDPEIKFLDSDISDLE